MAILQRVACWTSKVTTAKAHTHTHTQKYEILIAFTPQQWFRERALMFRCTYVAYLVFLSRLSTEIENLRTDTS